jgi:GT2 family glycosyltransferase
MVSAGFPKVDLIVNEKNGGYAYANNVGLRHLGFARGGGETQDVDVNLDDETAMRLTATPVPRYALLLNPDTVLPPLALEGMVGFMDSHPWAGAAGPRLVRPDGSLDKACRRSFPSPEVSLYRMLGLSALFPKSKRFGRYNLTYLDPNQVTEVDSVVGAFMMVRREAIEQVGLLDESFFMYGEDLDWAYRIKAAGWQVWYNPRVTVLHVKRAASRGSLKARVEFYRAMVIFYNKHYASETPAWQHVLILTGIYLKGMADILKWYIWRR